MSLKEKKIAAAKKIEFSAAEIEKMLNAWENKEHLFTPEKIIKKYFSEKDKGFSNDEENEFLRICVVNQVYGTNLSTKDVMQLSHFFAKNQKRLNEKIFEGDASIVSDITCSIKEKQGKYCYSFATKYCSFAVPDMYADNFPIYDSYMSELYKTRTEIWNPNGEKGFFKYYFDSWEGIPERDTRRYEIYRKAVYMMQKELEKIRKLTVKQLDQYLWYAMKSYSEPTSVF